MTDTADSPLLDFLLAVLASVMAAGLGDTGLGDAGLARRAAVQAIEAYWPRWIRCVCRHPRTCRCR